jgi:hypothetical protein
MVNEMRALILGVLVGIVFVACTTASAPSTTVSEMASPGAATSRPPTPIPPPTPTPTPALDPPATRPPDPSPSADPTPGTTPGHKPKPTLEPIPTMPPFAGPPKLLLDGARIVASDRGGCGDVYYQGQAVAYDDCGPHRFVLDAPAVIIEPGAAMTFATPRHWRFSADEIDADHAWVVVIAQTADLADREAGDQESIPLGGIGQRLGRSTDPARRVQVTAPDAPGEYLLELDGELERDGWTFTEYRHFWRISIR